MEGKKSKRRKKSRSKANERGRRARPGQRTVSFGELAEDGFHRAFHSHIQELSYELLKDPEYQEFMQQWTEGFLAALLEGVRRQRRGARKS